MEQGKAGGPELNDFYDDDDDWDHHRSHSKVHRRMQWGTCIRRVGTCSKGLNPGHQP